jgi:hypothetical protein|tara:strand:+ start:208 stop:483 length:276 start_codon:yes stop_codon:yes gene_type:complete
MKALIFNNKVVDVKETEFPVHNSMTWANCGDEVKIGFSYNGSTFISNEPTAEEIQAIADAKTEKANDKASGISKLKALGLSSSEIDALTGR